MASSSMFGHGNTTPFWTGGPAPGQFYSFPGSQQAAAQTPAQRTLYPVVTGSSVLGIQFEGGVVIAADMLGSYGSLARFRDCPRLFKVNDTTVVGAAGDYADFQYLTNVIEQQVIDEECLNDGFGYTPKSLHCWLTRVLYNRRSKFNPLWNTYIVAGIEDQKPFLGYVDKIGMAYEATSLACGFGAYIALYQVAVITKDGVDIKGPIKSETNWEVAHMIKGYE
ncbi:proteasome subunit beta [Elysia marginata]|uniref:Proteasome subunit beta n=1 Tax=Elysia marginata TaxID=1093978 RepID=A0AAV4EK65_9GAST|nr:proteasome subunit beta [Elysia marginata]